MQLPTRNATLDIPRIRAEHCVVFAAGLCLAALLLYMTPKMGVLVIPVSGFLFLVVPWLCRHPFWFFLWVVFTFPIIWPARIAELGGLPDLTYGRGMTVILLGTVFVHGILGNGPLPSLGTRATIFLVSFTSIFAGSKYLGGVVNPDFGDFVNFMFLPLSFYYLAKTLVVSRRQVVLLLAAILLMCCAISFSGIPAWAIQPTGELVTGESADGTRLNYDQRAVGLVGNPALFGGYSGLGALVSLFALQYAPRRGLRLLLIGLIAFFLCCVYLSLTRSAWLAVFVAFFLVQFFLKDTWKATVPLMIAFVLILAVLWGVLSDSAVMQQRVLESEHIIGRVDRAIWCVSQFLRKPIFGWGLGATNYLMPLEFGEGGFSSSHNTFLSLMLDGGLVLFLGFVSLPVYWLMTTLRLARTTSKDNFDRNVAVTMAGFVVIYILAGLSLELRYFAFYNAMLWTAGAVIERAAVLATDQG